MATFFVYVLRSLKDLKLCIGITSNLAARARKHEQGGVPSTRHRRPLELVYWEKVGSRVEARRREKYLKSGPGHAFLNQVVGRAAARLK